MPLPPRRVLRQFRYAMYFDGVDDYIVIPYSPSIPSNNQVFSVIQLIMPIGVNRWKFGYHHEGWAYNISINPGNSGFRVHRDDGTYLWYVDVSYMFSSSQWYQLGQAWNGSNDYYILNGGLYTISLPNRTGTRAVGNPRVFIGYNSYDKVYTDTIMLAQVLIYSRALSGSEIQWNFRNPDNPVRNGLVLWLQAHPDYVKDIDGDGVLEWVDLSGYGNHGKIYGAQLVQLVKTPARILTPARVLPAAR